MLFPPETFADPVFFVFCFLFFVFFTSIKRSEPLKKKIATDPLNKNYWQMYRQKKWGLPLTPTLSTATSHQLWAHAQSCHLFHLGHR